MIKKVMLITLRQEICEMYKKELDEVFKGYIELYTYTFENTESEHIKSEDLKDMDMFLVTSDNVFSLIRNNLLENVPVVYVNFTFLQEKIDLLKTLPRDTNAYIGFNSYSASFKTVSLLYEMGLNNLNIKIYEPLKTPPTKIDVGIISENSNIFPKETEHIISIGKRKISFMTLMDISIGLGIMDDTLENNIYRYSEGIVKHDNCLNYFYGESSSVKIQLQTVVNCIDDAFLLLNNSYIILDYNLKLSEMFKIKNSKLIGNNIFYISEFSDFSSIIKQNIELKNELVTIKSSDTKILISKKIIHDIKTSYNVYILIIKDVTNIIHLENTLRKQILKKGHIAKYEFSQIKGTSSSIVKCIEKAKKIASIDKPTLIIGESGTGKELFTQSIHNASIRKNFPFVAINCAALSPTLLESELFGYEEGAFTGAKKGGKMGVFEAAHRGTLFLDEIGEINLETQAKLLRVLEEKEIMKLGSNEIISVDIRIIAATNKNPNTLIDEGKFRLDLFYRLNTVMLKIPPLCERNDDILILSQIFLEEGNYDKTISKELFEFMKSYSWPGNIREFKNCIDYMASIANGNILNMSHLPEYILDSMSKMNYKPLIDNIPDYDENLGFHETAATNEVLKILSQKNLGRRELLKKLYEQHICISEYKLRNILENLSDKGYVYFGKGRAGTIITNKGKEKLI